MDQDQVLAIRNAIDWEKASYEMYNRLLRESPTRNLQVLFNTLAMEELRHAALLQECLRGGNIAQAKLKARVRQEELNITGQLSPTVSMEGVRSAMELAMKKEHGAHERYINLMNNAESDLLRDLFLFLAGEEERHERLLRQEYAKL